MPGVLFPAYQKLYSALSNLERFDKEANFYDNISCLDTFFSEYRNVTFVLQAQLKHTAFFGAYEKNRDLFLKDHWFIEKRNETIKQQPFRLIKNMSLIVYFPFQGVPVLEKDYSAENDIPLKSLIPAVKTVFSGIEDHEIFFSVSFSFHEENSDIDLFEKLVSGITSMLQFMEAMEGEICEDCPLCNQLKEKIGKMTFINVPRDFLLTNDYVYYSAQDTFERGGRIAMMLLTEGKKVANHTPLTNLTQSKLFYKSDTPFECFAFMHAALRSIKPGCDIMPAIMVVYEDETYDLDAFHADIKTTMYRKINDVATIIESQNVREVCFMCLYSVLPISQNVPIISKERIKQSSEDILVCASIDAELNEKEYVFDGKAMEQPEYVLSTIKYGMQESLNISQRNMFPVWYAFKKKAEKLSTQE